MTLQRILCPIDIYDSCAETLRFASELCLSSSAELHVLYVVEDFVIPGIGIQLSLVNISSDIEYRTAQNIIVNIISRFVSSSLTAHSIIRRGNTPFQIIHEALEKNIDLIILSRKNRTMTEELLFPSVTDAVIHRAPCATLVIPQESSKSVEETAVREYDWNER